LTAPHPIKPTSLRCRSAWQPNLGRGFTYRCGKSVQTTGTTSYIIYVVEAPPLSAEDMEKISNRFSIHSVTCF
jgi:hypothetical protein